MIVRLLKSYQINTGKVLPVGTVVPRRRLEALEMIKEKIAEQYGGKFPPKKMKSELFKPKK